MRFEQCPALGLNYASPPRGYMPGFSRYQEPGNPHCALWFSSPKELSPVPPQRGWTKLRSVLVCCLVLPKPGPLVPATAAYSLCRANIFLAGGSTLPWLAQL